MAGTLLFIMLDNFTPNNTKEELSYSEFKQEVQSKKVGSIADSESKYTTNFPCFWAFAAICAAI